MIQKGGILENKREKKKMKHGVLNFFERRIRRARGTCDRKPQTLF
jgi:hypothetical protein